MLLPSWCTHGLDRYFLSLVDCPLIPGDLMFMDLPTFLWRVPFAPCLGHTHMYTYEAVERATSSRCRSRSWPARGLVRDMSVILC